MKVLCLNAHEDKGGAARAALRLCKGLRDLDVDVEFRVQRASGGGRSWVSRAETPMQKVLSYALPLLDDLPHKLYRGAHSLPWSTNWLQHGLITNSRLNAADIVHLHWVGSGFLPMSVLAKIERPVVWTLHDTWAFTGGCHYPDDCSRFEESCGACPQLRSRCDLDLSRFVLERKRRALAGKQLHIVSPSNWLAEMARRSALLRDRVVSVIPNGLDFTIYKPIERATARALWNLPADRYIIIFGAAGPLKNERKGFDLLKQALGMLDATLRCRSMLVVFGSNEPPGGADFSMPVHFVGELSDDVSLACLYSAANVMVVPSKQENLANTIIESLACGTPVAAFDIGGNRDLISHRENGWLAKPFNVADLGEGIGWIIREGEKSTDMRLASRVVSQRRFALPLVADAYRQLFEKLVREA
ncbi:MAG: glycosyltransferase family 4 protein [Methylocella sp.]